MLHYASRKLTNQLLNNSVITPAMAEVYQYGFELTLSTLFTSSAILLVACLMDSFFFGLLYFAVSIPIRMTAGGYHAPTYFRCFLLSIGTYFAVSLLARCSVPLMLSYPFWLGFLFISTYYILANCPVKNPHHPISTSVLKKNKRITVIYLCALCSLMVCLYAKLQQSNILNFIVLTVSSVAVLILPMTKKGVK